MSQEADNVDQMYHAWLGKMTLGLSPVAYMLAYLDWLMHLSVSPGKQGEIIQKAIRKSMPNALMSMVVKCIVKTVRYY